MSRLQWILAGCVLATWIPSYIWFFHKDLKSWMTGYRPRRDAARKAKAEQAAAKARMLDDLAAKYMAPPSGPGTRG